MRNYMIGKEFIENEGVLYEVVDSVKEEYMSIPENREYWKTRLKADAIFKKNGYMHFCKIIPDAEIINDGE